MDKPKFVSLKATQTLHEVAIVWFRRDLRLRDNPALLAACERARYILPVYIHAPEELEPWAPGAASNWWLHHSLSALQAQLRARRSELYIFRGRSAETLRALIAHTGASLVVWNRLYEPQALQRDEAVAAALQAQGVEVQTYNAALLVEPWEVASQRGEPFRVFSPFWRAAKQRPFAQAQGEPPTFLPMLSPPSEVPGRVELEALGLLPTPNWAAGWEQLWQPGEVGAHQTLERFLRGGAQAPVLRYGYARNRLDRDGTSRLSPHLHFGEISPRQILQALRAQGFTLEGPVEPFVRELGWREFAHHVLYHFPHTPEQPLDPKFVGFCWREDPGGRLLRAWQRGRTGIPIVDAAMRQLWTTGWMHNRARMIVGSFLTKNLRLPWQAGARWFWDTLVDADLAANTLGWQWAAGSGADAAPYFRIFNPLLQSQKFDPEGRYIAQYVPELRSLPPQERHDPALIALRAEAGRYARPVIDLRASRAEALAAFEALRRS